MHSWPSHQIAQRNPSLQNPSAVISCNDLSANHKTVSTGPVSAGANGKPVSAGRANRRAVLSGVGNYNIMPLFHACLLNNLEGLIRFSIYDWYEYCRNTHVTLLWRLEAVTLLKKLTPDCVATMQKLVEVLRRQKKLHCGNIVKGKALHPTWGSNLQRVSCCTDWAS